MAKVTDEDIIAHLDRQDAYLEAKYAKHPTKKQLRLLLEEGKRRLAEKVARFPVCEHCGDKHPPVRFEGNPPGNVPPEVARILKTVFDFADRNGMTVEQVSLVPADFKPKK